jgi:hypothetical protein
MLFEDARYAFTFAADSHRALSLGLLLRVWAGRREPLKISFTKLGSS